MCVLKRRSPCPSGVMIGKLEASTEQKLDMALDDLVDRKAGGGPEALDEERDHNGHRSSGYGPAGRSPLCDRQRDQRQGPYSWHEGKGKGSSGKGKGRRRLPPEEKALLNTHCFFNPEGHLVVKLYDTEVLVVKKNAEVKVDVADASSKQQSNSQVPAAIANGEDPAPTEKAAETALVAPPEKTADITQEKTANIMALVLTSGKFRTAETKYILNEALEPLAFKVIESTNAPSQWTVNGEAQVQPFEDGMEVNVKSPVADANAVKNHMAEKIQDAKTRDAHRHSTGTAQRQELRDRGMLPPEHWGPSSGLPQAPHGAHRPPEWPPGPAPLGWCSPLPPGWRGPLLAWCGPLPPWSIAHGLQRHPPPPHGGSGRQPGLPTPRGPLPDHLFQ